MLKKLFLFPNLLFVSFLSLSQQCMLIEIPLSQKINEAGLIVEGKILNQQSFWNDNPKQIYTASIIEVYKIFKGNIAANQNQIILITLGGQVGNKIFEVYPSEDIHVDDAGLFFLLSSSINVKHLDSSVQFIVSGVQHQCYAGPQGFIRYDIRKLTASAPFQTYTNLKQLYDLIKAQTKRKYQNVQTNNWKQKQKSFFKQSGMFIKPVISGFSPNPISAGNEAVLTISGSGFGTTQGSGNVYFKNVNTGGSNTTFPLSSQIISWSDNQILVQVPSKAGTGTIQVQNNDGDVGISSSLLTIDYAILNDISGSNAYIRDLFDQNGAGGYTWQYANNFTSTPLAVSSFERALETWTCATFVNWKTDNTTIVDVAQIDNVNIVRWNSFMPAGVLAWYLRYSDICVSGSMVEAPSPELDIEFNSNFSWQFGPGNPSSSEVDFQSVAAHELGHAHQLGHIIASGKVMHYAIGYGMVKRNLNIVSEIAGGNYVISKSTQTNLCSGNQIIPLTSSNCATNAPSANFSANNQQICPGFSVQFTDISTGSPVSWQWSFPSGTPSSSSL